VEKTLLAGQQLPSPLHWFKWQAYTTWLSGLALLLVVYWLGGRAVMADPGVASITPERARLIGVASVFGGWALYEVMNRYVAPRAPIVSSVLWVSGLIAISYALTRTLNGRAAFLHVGAMLGTIMAGNVFFTIVPSQRELVASVEQQESGGRLAELSARAKRVSIHNNYFTFPVIVLMVSNHFPALYGHRLNWLLLIVLVVAGVAVRHVLNIRWNLPGWKPILAGVIAASVVSLWAIMKFGAQPAAAALIAPTGPVTFADVRHIIDRRCAVCHSERPTDPAFPVAPGGVIFDTPEQIIAHASRIRERAFVTRTMPLGNKTNITDAERAILGAWASQPASSR
jgi:uncharacterized membrane protein